MHEEELRAFSRLTDIEHIDSHSLAAGYATAGWR